jgi:hypothetical protein
MCDRGLGVVRDAAEAARRQRRPGGKAMRRRGLVSAMPMWGAGCGAQSAARGALAYASYRVAAAKGDRGAQQGITRIGARLTPHELQLATTRIGVMERQIAVPN